MGGGWSGSLKVGRSPESSGMKEEATDENQQIAKQEVSV